MKIGLLWLPLSSVVFNNCCYWFCTSINFDCQFLCSTCFIGTDQIQFRWTPLYSLFSIFFFGIVAAPFLPPPPPWLPSIIFVPVQSTSIICSCLAFNSMLEPEAASSLFPLHSFLILKRRCRHRNRCRCFVDDKKGLRRWWCLRWSSSYFMCCMWLSPSFT